MNLIGLDIGTTTICGVLYSRGMNRTLRTSIRDNTFISSDPGEYLQDPNDIFQKVKSILDELIDFSEVEVEGISLSAQMHGILYVDKEGQPVSPYYTWQNQRGRKESGGTVLEAEVSEQLGYPVFTGYGIVTHTSLSREGTVPPAAAGFCNIGDFVCMLLSGRKSPVTDITLGSSMGIADIKTGGHSRELSRFCSELPAPRIVSSTERLGEYRKIPVIQPLGDNQASFLGSVRQMENSLLLNYGTAGQISFFRSDYGEFPGFETRPLGNEGFIHAAFSLCGGNSYKIMMRFFEEAVSLFAQGSQSSVMKTMDELDLDFSKDEIECMPYFLGRRGGKEEYGYFRNLTDANFSPGNLVQSLIKGMVRELHQYYALLPADIQNGIHTLVGAGNGIRKNRHMIQAAELMYGKPVSLLDLSEESCLGAVINAGKGVGIYADYGEGASEIVKYRICST